MLYFHQQAMSRHFLGSRAPADKVAASEDNASVMNHLPKPFSSTFYCYAQCHMVWNIPMEYSNGIPTSPWGCWKDSFGAVWVLLTAANTWCVTNTLLDTSAKHSTSRGMLTPPQPEPLPGYQWSHHVGHLHLICADVSLTKEEERN